jgi:PiT family inorganic phosphate transporter
MRQEARMDLSLLVVVVIVTALAFDFTNGFHDTANAMATSIATGALSPRLAVGVSAVFNLVGAFLSVQVAKTISSGIVDEAKINSAIIFGGLVGAIVWNLLTWLLGLPSSSSHALFGGLIGATWIAAGSDAVHFTTVIEKVIVPAVASPIIAAVVATAATFLAYKVTARADKTERAKGFKAGQIISASLVSLAHGTNDAQKSVGVITLTLIAAGTLPSGSNPPLLVILGSGLAISLGTFLGGWRIIRTLGKGLTEIETPQGFAAEASATATILASTQVGFALSTTHVATGAIIGSGVGKRLSEVRWGVAGRMATAWLFTLPAAAIVGAIAGRTASLGNVGTVVVALAAIAVAVGAYLLSRRQPVSAGNVNDMPANTPAPAAV